MQARLKEREIADKVLPREPRWLTSVYFTGDDLVQLPVQVAYIDCIFTAACAYAFVRAKVSGLRN